MAVLLLLSVSMFLVHPDWSVAEGQVGWLLMIVFALPAVVPAIRKQESKMASLRESVRTTVQSAAMSFLAGYVDTLGFVALFGLFTAHVTGNFVLIGSELAHPSHGVLIKFVAFPAFILSVAFTRMAVVWLERAGQAPLPWLLALQLLSPGGVLFTFSCSGGISADLFHKIVASAGADAGVDGYILERLGGAPDHPMTLEFPEGEYLKGLV
eukprot:gene10850-13895_t